MEILGSRWIGFKKKIARKVKQKVKCNMNIKLV